MPDWIKSPQIILTLILFAVSVFVSLYAQEIRQWMKRPGQKVKKWELTWAKQRLAHLKLIHDNSYQLLLYLAWEFAHGLRYTFYVGTFAGLIYIGLAFWWKLDMRFIPSVLSVVVGGIIGKAIKVYEILTALYRYPSEVAKLEEIINSIEKE